MFLLVIIFVSSFAAAQGAEPSSVSQPANNSSASRAQVTTAAEDVPLGEPFEWHAPKYPKQARKIKLQGDVVLVLSVDEEGNVSGASALSGASELVKAAVDAVRKWSYVPYDVNGSPVPVTTKTLMRFSLSETRPANVSVAFEMPKVPVLGPVYKLGQGIIAPKPVYSPDPHYSKQAKKDRYQGRCMLAIVVGPDGRTYNIRVTRPLGEGLDQKAIEAVRNWRFEPGRKDGKPVALAVNIHVDFVLD